MKFEFKGGDDGEASVEAFGLSWAVGTPVEIADADMIDRLSRHPHFRIARSEMVERIKADAQAIAHEPAHEMTDEELDRLTAPDVATEPDVKRRGGRPLGSKNKPRDV